MIRTAFTFIKNELDAYFVARENDPALYAPGSNVEIQALASPAGAIELNDNLHVYMMLVGIEEGRREGKRPLYMATENNDFYKLNPPVELELSIMFTAHRSSYGMALRDITNVISFFQANPVFDRQRYPALNASVNDPDATPWQLIDRLSFRMANLGFEQQNNLWAMIGTKYLPNVIYKCNVLTVFDTQPKEKAIPVAEFNIEEP